MHKEYENSSESTFQSRNTLPERIERDTPEYHTRLYNEAQIAALLTVYKMRSVSVEELIGFREALLESAYA